MSKSQAILSTKQKHPEFTLKQIAGINRVSYKYVQQVLLKNGLLPKNSSYGKLGFRIADCKFCGQSFSFNVFSKKGRQKGYYRGTFCSMECQEKNRFVTLVCFACGKSFQRTKTGSAGQLYRGYKHSFCSRVCFGKYIGNTFGKFALKRSHNASKMRLFCGRGLHLLRPENIVYQGRNRYCKTCYLERRKKYYYNKKLRLYQERAQNATR